jgi:hypothetical protein
MRSINVKCEIFLLCVPHISEYNDIINQLNGHKCLERQLRWWRRTTQKHMSNNSSLVSMKIVHEISDLISFHVSSLFYRCVLMMVFEHFSSHLYKSQNIKNFGCFVLTENFLNLDSHILQVFNFIKNFTFWKKN